MFIVFDLEATCWETREERALNKSEIIQIGAVKLDLYDGKIIDTFDMLVRPRHSDKLSRYCVELTGITMESLLGSEYFEQVYPKFAEFCGSRHINTLVAWGAFDGDMLDKACDEHGLQKKHPYHYINASLLFREKRGIKKRMGLRKAVEYCGLKFIGTHHDALADAINAASVFCRTMCVQLKEEGPVR